MAAATPLAVSTDPGSSKQNATTAVAARSIVFILAAPVLEKDSCLQLTGREGAAASANGPARMARAIAALHPLRPRSPGANGLISGNSLENRPMFGYNH
jgi:hypothetical protein